MTKQIIAGLATSNAGWAPMALRLTAGLVFIAHGAQKLFGWFGGHGLEATGQWLESIGLAPGYLLAALAGGAEFFGGIALIVGLLVRPASVVLAFTMLVAMIAAHGGNGLFLSNNGYEYALVLFAVSVALAVSGAGQASVDAVVGRRLGAR